MALLFDIFGFLTVLIDGLAVCTLAFTLGGMAFLTLLALPLAGVLGPTGRDVHGRTRVILAWSALGLAVMTVARTALLVVVLAGTAEMPLDDTLGAVFVHAGAGIVAGAVMTFLVVISRFYEHRPLLLPVCACMILGSMAFLTHGAARLDDRWLLMGMMVLHLIAASVWLGGLPYFLSALAQSRDSVATHRIGSRFSLMCMLSVATLLASGIAMTLRYVDSVEALYGTAYGAMLSTKVLMFVGLLGFGFKNMLIIRRLQRSPDAPVLVMRRFAEVELGVAIAIFLSAASLTSLPPAADLTKDRITLAELFERLTPGVPLLESPDHANLSIPQLEMRIAAAREAGRIDDVPAAYVPGAGVVIPTTAVDIAWSEYNHHWAGIAVILIGLVALLDRSGRVPIARHWPLLFLVLAAFVVARSDPEAWPLGSLGFWESLRDPEVMQHRIFSGLVIAFALFEWAVRTGVIRSHGAALVFPLMVAAGGTLMLTHSHQLGNVRQELLIEWTHIPVAVLGIAGGWARWLELRLPPPRGGFYGWLWPLTFVVIGATLLFYREA
ncbi:MAG: CopD family protein [Rhodospirillaceae bacterium]